MSEDYMGTVDSGGGLGNLADELADAWGDGEGYEDTSGFETNGQAENMEGFHEDKDTPEQETPREPMSPDQGRAYSRPDHEQDRIKTAIDGPNPSMMDLTTGMTRISTNLASFRQI
jgi:hypothetical protein